jgi:hypothetical protein
MRHCLYGSADRRLAGVHLMPEPRVSAALSVALSIGLLMLGWCLVCVCV